MNLLCRRREGGGREEARGKSSEQPRGDNPLSALFRSRESLQQAAHNTSKSTRVQQALNKGKAISKERIDCHYSTT